MVIIRKGRTKITAAKRMVRRRMQKRAAPCARFIKNAVAARI